MPMTTTTETPRRARRAFCAEPGHRRRALARARRCATCRQDGAGGYGSPKDGISACLGCGTLIGYYSCMPGSCVACAHDPCWAPVR